ncbi:MAG: 50S ribosomal protein L15 [bacterium]|nr:50S ribosomal protein L15 [bacterium]
MRLHELQPAKGSRHARKRVGCGSGSGHGKTSGRGHKGQKARSGGSVRPGFEGGQTPLYRRLPRRGFNNTAFATVYETVNVGELNEFAAQARVGREELRARGLIRGKQGARLKVLGDGELTVALHVVADAFSKRAEEKIVAAGGRCERVGVMGEA